jgi:P-type conjugative transfer protein TrbJ
MKTTIKKLGISVAVASMLFGTSANAGSVGGFGGATEFTQILNNAELAGQSAKQLQQYYTQLQQWQTQWQEWQRKIQGLQMMVQNIGQLPENMKSQFLNMAMQMKNQMEQGQAIAYSAANIDQQFNNIFKGYDYFLQQSNATSQSFQAAYKTIYQSTRDTALNALKTLGIQEKDLQDDQAFMSHLRNAMNTTQGTEASIAVANQLTYHQTQSIQKLQKTIMAQANLQAEYIAAQNQEDQMGRAAVESFASEPADTHSDDRSPIRYLE